MPETSQLSSFLSDNHWVAVLLAAALAVVLSLGIHRAVRALLRRTARGSLLLHALLDRTERSACIAWPLIALQIVWQAAPDTLPWISTVRHVNGLALIAVLTALAMGVIGGLADGLIARHPSTMEDNLAARRIQTQARVLSRSAMVLVVIAGTAMALLTFPGARQLGATLLASAGVLGIVAGIAARPIFSNLIAGLQLALAQPIRLDDVLIVEGEFGRVEEITGTYVVLKIWDERRMIVPLQWFIEHPFENWTRNNSAIHQPVYLHVDFATPLAPLRAELERIVRAAPEWDGRTCTLVVADTSERTMKLRALISAADASRAFDLGCKVREGLLAFLNREHPDSLPQLRTVQAEPLPA
ncbi:mechanosensitive ion channel family protein [Caenimonas sedimenti]|uniref:Mechanosensitive ion channel family protein n=1 Tax=Caenimonas sedimenti TaxID=2596921 RepID=A0A562ZMB4_9BURK|nr:mechanosensitive ion channel family protein [Caenimonas sedimenti]TWO69531.1 mechanosensitive ion channel family protein [Caenimonas sedimenti]